MATLGWCEIHPKGRDDRHRGKISPTLACVSDIGTGQATPAPSDSATLTWSRQAPPSPPLPASPSPPRPPLAPGPAPAIPVFADLTGARKRLVRGTGLLVGALLVGSLVVVALGLTGAPDSPFRFWQAQRPAAPASGGARPGGGAAPGAAVMLPGTGGTSTASPAAPRPKTKASPSAKASPTRSATPSPSPSPGASSTSAPSPSPTPHRSSPSPHPSHSPRPSKSPHG